jgi:translocation and assembly module TamB
MRWILAAILVIVQALGVAAQEDKDRITRYLEETLSDLGRDVRIEGFKGALSSRATMQKLTIADGTGIWLTLNDAVLDWNRAAILGGRIEINEISAARIEMARLPAGGSGASPEAGRFALPELPVSIKIDAIKADKVELGASVIGVPTTISLNGGLNMAAGEGTAALSIKRLTGPRGSFNLDAGFANATRVLKVQLGLSEAADGIVANLLKLPGKPALALTVSGISPIDDFKADVVLKSDGSTRLAGQVETRAGTTGSIERAIAGPQLARVVAVDVAGDLAPLFAPKYQAFFGRDVGLKTKVNLFDNGAVRLEDLTVKSAALALSGEVSLSADGLPEMFRLDALLEDGKGGAVLLPLPGAETRVERMNFVAAFDSATDDVWSLSGTLEGFSRPEMAIDALDLAADGLIRHGQTRQVTAHVTGTARGLAPTDPGLAEALGPVVSIVTDLRWREGLPLEVSGLSVDARGAVLSGAGKIDGLDSAVTVAGAARAQVGDLSRFSILLNRPLGGALEARLDGNAALLTGAFDLNLVALARDLDVGVAKLGPSLAGDSQLDVGVMRDQEGLTIRHAKVTAKGGEAEASGQIATGMSDVTFTAALVQLGDFIPDLSGPASLSGTARENGLGWSIVATGAGPHATRFDGELDLPKQGEPSVRLNANIGSVGTILPDLPGTATVQATAQRQGENWAVSANAQGPAGSRADLAGTVAESGRAATLDMNGELPLGLLNRRLQPNSMQGSARYVLRLDGPINLSSVSGQISTAGARLSVPGLRTALSGIDATVTMAGNTAEVQASAEVATGGRLSTRGRIALAAPRSTDIEMQFDNVRVVDPQLYETRVRGALKLDGTFPANLMASGRLVLDETEIRVPSTGMGTIGSALEIVHLNEPTAVRRTRGYAGLLDNGGNSGASVGGRIGLDIQILAENRLFVRGRGLDAELGGELRLTGTTADIIPLGQFGLIRGRLDILGKRLTLEEGSARLQGDMIPMLRLVARTTSDDTVLRVIVEGPADAPEISFVSEPDLPGEEVVARLLFGRGIGSLSALQALQLASAVATLAGRGGVGIVERIRQTTGFDDLDLTTDAAGGTSLRAGKYISENIYTDVEIDSDGKSRVNLNLDVTPSTKLRGQLGTDGNTGIGLFFEKDY